MVMQLYQQTVLLTGSQEMEMHLARHPNGRSNSQESASLPSPPVNLLDDQLQQWIHCPISVRLQLLRPTIKVA